jgi:EAL and modified HD-GYP domain-containing signal transduction protein
MTTMAEPAQTLTSDSRDGVFVARQPILNRTGQVFGYELLYRAGSDAQFCTTSTDLAASRVLSDTVLNIGLDTLTAGRKAFMNVGRTTLLSGHATLLPAKAVVLEVLESVTVDEPVLQVCRSLRGKGYSIALDDYVPGTSADRLLPYANFVKVDVLNTSRDEWVAIRRSMPSSVTMLAEKVETAEVHEDLLAIGYHLFQGYYFCRPKMFKGGALSSHRLAYAQLLMALNDEHVTVSQVEDLIKHDASLSYRVLRCINSAAYGIRRQIQSIRQAVVLLGLDQVRKWASVWALAGLNEGASAELVTVAIVRARACELLAQSAMPYEQSSEYFLLGLCSLLDVILKRPMAEALSELPLSDAIRRALLGEDNRPRQVLDTVIAYERASWAEASARCAAAGLSMALLPGAYADALRWANEMKQAANVG